MEKAAAEPLRAEFEAKVRREWLGGYDYSHAHPLEFVALLECWVSCGGLREVTEEQVHQLMQIMFASEVERERREWYKLQEQLERERAFRRAFKVIQGGRQ